MKPAYRALWLLLVLLFASAGGVGLAPAQQSGKPNVVYFLVDNLGMGELSSYSGGPLRGVSTPRIDALAKEGMRLLNFAPETQCTPSRSALMTGRYSIRSGNQTVLLPGSHGGLVKWERTLGDIFSEAGYATAIVGKWHIGDSAGRWPIDHGFDEWYGIPRSYDEALWPGDPWYDPKRDPVTRVLEGRKGQSVRELEQLTVEVRRDIDVEYMKRAKAFLKRSTDAGKPFFLYFNHSMMHLPTIPRAEFKGKTGHGDWADSLLQLDTDFGTLLDYLKELGVADNTIVVFSGDNGPEELEPWRGSGGPWEGSYFTGMEGSLRTPAIVRYPGRVPAGQVSNEIVHITDMFTTLTRWAGLEIPKDRVIDGVDQSAFFGGKQKNSNRRFPLLDERYVSLRSANFLFLEFLRQESNVPTVARATNGAPTHKGDCGCTCQQDGEDGLGHHGSQREIQGAEAAARSVKTSVDRPATPIGEGMSAIGPIADMAFRGANIRL